MDLNIVNWTEINDFLKTLKNQYPHPLMSVFVDYKVRDYLVHNHYYIPMTLNEMTSEEKDLVKHKEGVYNRVLLGTALLSYLSRKCDVVAIEVVKGRIKTAQDVTNLPRIDKMNKESIEEFVWVKDDFKIKTLTTKLDLLREGEKMKNCLGKHDCDFKKYDYYAMTKSDKEFISFKINKKFKYLTEAKYKANRSIRKEDRDLINSFLVKKYSVPESQIDLVSYLNISHFVFVLLSAFVVLTGTLGIISYVLNSLGFYNDIYSLILKNKEYLFLGFPACFVLMIPLVGVDPHVSFNFKIQKKSFLGQLVEWIND